VGECVAKPPLTGDRTHHLQCIEWESYVTSHEIRTPSCSFPLAASLPLVLAGGSQGTWRVGSNQSRITESKFCEQTPIILLGCRFRGHILIPMDILNVYKCKNLIFNLWIFKMFKM